MDPFCLINEEHNVSRETFEKLDIYRKSLIKWQGAINLVSRGTLKNFWIRHALDSIQVIKYIRGNKVLDIGSGGGFPGMIVAMCGNFDVTCVDSDARKMIFLEEIARLTDTKITIKTIRIEQLSEYNFDTICARGFSTLTKLIGLTKKHSPQKYGVFLKGNQAMIEIQNARKLYDFTYNLHRSKSDTSGQIIVVDNIA